MRMVFKYPGRTKLHGIMCDWKNVPNTAQSLAAAEADGWYQSPALAFEAMQPKPQQEPVDDADTDNAPDPGEQTRDDLLTIARELGVKVDGRWSDERLRKEVGL